MAKDDEILETWQNTGRGSVDLTRYEGRERSTETVQGGRTFSVTRAERRRMQMGMALEAYDPFLNGTFALLQTQGEEAPEAGVADNPNALTDAQVGELWAKRADAFEKAVAEVTSPVTMRRIVEAGAEHPKATAPKQMAAAARLAELAPDGPQVVEHLSVGASGIGEPQPLPERGTPQMPARTPGEPNMAPPGGQGTLSVGQ